MVPLRPVVPFRPVVPVGSDALPVEVEAPVEELAEPAELVEVDGFGCSIELGLRAPSTGSDEATLEDVVLSLMTTKLLRGSFSYQPQRCIRDVVRESDGAGA